MCIVNPTKSGSVRPIVIGGIDIIINHVEKDANIMRAKDKQEDQPTQEIEGMDFDRELSDSNVLLIDEIKSSDFGEKKQFDPI